MTGAHATTARPGDWLEVHGLPGKPPRRGRVEEVLGRPGHEHYLVRWDERHTSIFFPTDGVTVVRDEEGGARSEPEPGPAA